MLIVTSNWAIADGTLVGPPPRRHADRFHSDLRRSAVQAGFRRDGSYRPIDRIEVVLAGDTFDWLLSDAWLGDSRPWHHPRRSGPAWEHVMARSLRQAVRPLARLVRIVRRGLAVPAADFRGRPLVGSETVVPVRATFLVGDRDARLEEAPSLSLAAHRGMSVGGRWTNGTVAISHGHEFDPLCGGGSGEAFGRNGGSTGGERPPTLHESIVVDLLAEFGATLRDRTAGHDAGRRLVRSLAEGHPLDLPRRLVSWVENAVGRGQASASDRERIVAAWRRAVAEWHRRARRQAPWSDAEFDAVEEIAARLDGLDRGAESAESTGPLRDPFAASPAGCVDPLRIAVCGHLSRRPNHANVGSSPVHICLGPPRVRRSSGMAALVRGSAVDVACVGASFSRVEDGPRSVVVFEAGEAGGSDTFVRVTEEDAEPEPRPSGGMPEGVRIVDAA
jgi:hypothetical protein